MTAPTIDATLEKDLRTAMSIELTTIPTYLYAYWSIETPAEGGSPAAAHIRQLIRSVIMEEMLHMGLVSNVLNAVGGTPALTEFPFLPRYPATLFRHPDHYPRALAAGTDCGLVVRLLPMSAAAADTFLRIELPEAQAPICHDAVQTIGQFYRQVVCPALGQASYRPGRRQLPAQDNPGAGKLIAVSDFASASTAIDVIVEQGEGTSGSARDDFHELAHYYKFKQVQAGLAGIGDDIYPVVPDPDASEYGPEARKLNTAFNTTYTALLDGLQSIMSSEDPEVFFDGTSLMEALGQQAATLRENGEPVPRDGTEYRPGPTFEYLGQHGDG